MNKEYNLIAEKYISIYEDTEEDDLIAGMEEAEQTFDLLAKIQNVKIFSFTNDTGINVYTGSELLKWVEEYAKELGISMIEALLGENPDISLTNFWYKIIKGDLVVGSYMDDRGYYNPVAYCIDKNKLAEYLCDEVGWDEDDALREINQYDSEENSEEDDDIAAGLEASEKLIVPVYVGFMDFCRGYGGTNWKKTILYKALSFYNDEDMMEYYYEYNDELPQTKEEAIEYILQGNVLILNGDEDTKMIGTDKEALKKVVITYCEDAPFQHGLDEEEVTMEQLHDFEELDLL